MLHRVNTETSSPHINQLVQITSQLVLHVSRTSVEIRQTNQAAFLNFVTVTVVTDVAATGMEVGGLIHGVIQVPVLSASPAGTTIRLARHVVDNRVNDNANTSSVTPINHRLELSFGPHTRFKLVRNRLVINPPRILTAINVHNMLLRGRCLNITVTSRTENSLTLFSNSVPRVREQNRNRILRTRSRSLSLTLHRNKSNKTSQRQHKRCEDRQTPRPTNTPRRAPKLTH